MKVKFWQFFFLFILISSEVFSQELEKIRINFRVYNGVNGAAVKNVVLDVRYAQTGNEIKPGSEKKETFYEIVKGATIKVKAEVPQFYPEEIRFETDRLYAGDVLEVKLNPRPAGSALISVLDSKSGFPLIASVNISFEGSSSTQETSEDKNELQIYFEKNGEYSFQIEADGYESQSFLKNLNINQKNEKIIVKLNRSPVLFNVLVKDKAGKQALGEAEISIKDTKGKLATAASKSSFYLLPDENYTISVSKEGYALFTSPVKSLLMPESSNIEVLMEAKSLAPFFVSAKNAISQKEIQTEIEVLLPSGKTEFAKSNSLYAPKEKGEYTFKINKENLGTYSQNAQTQFSDAQKQVDVNFEILQKTTMKIVVLDSLTQKPIPNPEIRLFNQKSNMLQGTQANNTKTYIATENDKLFYEISADGYPERTGNIVAKDGVVTVFLAKKIVINFQELEISLIDNVTKKPIDRTQLLILDENNKVVEVLYNSAKGTYLTYKIIENKPFYVQAKAEGYLELSNVLNTSERKVTLGLTPTAKKEIIISIYDVYTKEMLVVNNLNVSINEQRINTLERNREYLISVSPGANFNIEFKQEGYPQYKNAFNQTELKDGRLNINIKKDTYPLTFTILNKLTDEQKDKALAHINELDGKSLDNKFNKTENRFELESDPNKTLQAEILVPGFREYKASNNREKLAMYDIKVELIPIETPKIEQPKVEPPKVEEPKVDPPKVVTAEDTTKTKIEIPKVETPVVVEKPKVESKENPIELPKSEPMIAKKGRKYPLDGVNFEQSKTTFLYGSELKLNELLDFMKNNPNVVIEITGHTDKVGDERQNQRLSEFRAKAVANWLFNKGVDRDRISTAGKGSSEPIAPNDTETTKAQNRRIEVLVVEE